MADLPKSMRAVILTGHGGFDKLQYCDDWPTPRPGPGEIIVKVGACGLNNTDINTRIGWYAKAVTQGITAESGRTGIAGTNAATGSWSSIPLSFPRIQGADVAGRIAAVGEGVDRARLGERVIVDPWLIGNGDPMNVANARYFGSECDGGFADYACVPAPNAIVLETMLSDAELATFPCALTTAENLVARTGLKPGETVIISGASGGVGSVAIQLCGLRGARVIAIASAAKADHLKDLGVAAIIDRNEPALSEAIQAAAGGPVDVVLDVVGGPMFAPLIDVLRQGGRYSSSGAIAGPDVRFDLRQLIYKDLQMTGATIVPPGTMTRLARLIERGHVRPLLAAAFPLKDLTQAQEAFLAKNHVGNIVVTMD